VVRVRPETPNEAAAIRAINEAAFGRPAEANMVDRVRRSPGFVPALSLVAEEDDGRIVGHALFSEVTIENERAAVSVVVIALGPIAVFPACQKRGVGGAMMRAGVAQAIALGYPAVVLIGHPGYYPRFGFVPGSRFGLTCAIPVPDDVFQVLPLRPDALAGITGTVVYPPAFTE